MYLIIIAFVIYALVFLLSKAPESFIDFIKGIGTIVLVVLTIPLLFVAGIIAVVLFGGIIVIGVKILAAVFML